MVECAALERRYIRKGIEGSNPSPSANLRLRFGWQANNYYLQGGVSMWHVYFLRLSNRDIYVGSTNDIKRRLKEHLQGSVLSTKAYQPVKLLAIITVTTEKKARILEKYCKTGSGKAIIKRRILTDEA